MVLRVYGSCGLLLSFSFFRVQSFNRTFSNTVSITINTHFLQFLNASIDTTPNMSRSASAVEFLRCGQCGLTEQFQDYLKIHEISHPIDSNVCQVPTDLIW